MSSHTVIKEISNEIKTLMGKAVTGYSPAIAADFATSDDFDPKKELSKVTLLLYKTDENPHYRNQYIRDIVTNTVEFSPVTLDLHYLVVVSVSGDKSREYEILGRIIQTMNENSSLESASLDSSGLNSEGTVYKIFLETLSLEDLSKIWTAFPALAPKTLVSYMVSPVTISAAPKPEDTRVISEEFRLYEIKKDGKPNGTEEN